jgi:hypothetical protein
VALRRSRPGRLVATPWWKVWVRAATAAGAATALLLGSGTALPAA